MVRTLWLLCAAASAGWSAGAPRIEYSLDVAPVWAGHPVGFDLLTQNGRQFVAFYDKDRKMTVAFRSLNSKQWKFVRLPSEVKWDSHNYVTMAIDAEGYLHLSGNMHVVPLIYFRTARPYDIETFERIPSMVGRNEQRCTYPRFLRGPHGEMIFTYRDGRSGSGDQIFNVYDVKARQWRRLLDTPFTDGQGKMNAYIHGPVLGPDGYYHLVWTWRDTPDCATNHDLSYARSKDLERWETTSGKPLTLPIRLETAEIVDPIPVRGGLINGNTKIGFDSKRRVIVSYHKHDPAGNTQIYCARLEEGRWKIYQISRWNYRWEFQGGGSIPFEITVGGVTASREGLTLAYTHAKHGSGAWRLDEETLRILGSATRAPQWPPELSKPESTFPGMQVHLRRGGGDAKYLLRWETLGPNRDRPREPPLPEPSMLRVYKLAEASGQKGR